MYGINESTPGPQWRALFDATWPGYRTWYEAPDDRPRPRLAVAKAQLTKHMPELVPTYERLVELTNKRRRRREDANDVGPAALPTRMLTTRGCEP